MNAIVNDRSLHFTVHGAGHGHAALLVPGTGCSSTTWPPELVDGLVAIGLDVITYDPRDTGLSAATEDSETYTLWDLAADAAGLIEVARPGEPVVVMGHSLGAAVAQILAVLRPDLVSALVLLAAPARPGRGLEIGPEGPRAATTDWDDRAAALGALVRSIGEGVDEDARWVQDLYAARPLPMTTRSVRRHSEAALATDPPTDAQLAEVRVPVLVIAGTHDQSVPTSNAVAITSDHPTAHLEVVEGLGHWPARSHLPRLVELVVDLLQGAGAT